MKIYVTAKPKKKKEFVEQTDATHYTVSVKEPAQKGQANHAIVLSLSKYFNVPRSQIILVSGKTSKHKIFRVPNHLVDFEPLFTQKITS